MFARSGRARRLDPLKAGIRIPYGRNNMPKKDMSARKASAKDFQAAVFALDTIPSTVQVTRFDLRLIVKAGK